MDSLTRIGRAVTAIYGALTEPDAEVAWLETLRHLVGAEHAVYLCVAAAGMTWHASGLDPNLSTLTEQAIRRTMLDPTLAKAPEMAAVRLSDSLPVAQLRRSDLYQEVIRPLSGGYAVSFAWRQADVQTKIVVCRSAECGRDFSQREVALLLPALTALRAAADVRAQLRNSLSAGHSALAALDAVRDGVLITDGRGLVRFANRAAESVLQARRGLTVNGGCLQGSSMLDNAALREALNRIAGIQESCVGTAHIGEQAQRSDSRITLAIGGRSGQAPLQLAAVPVSNELKDAYGLQEPAVVWVITDQDRVAASGLLAAATGYGLTPRETALAMSLVEGKSLAQAAACMGITRGTARQYLKSVFGKLGVRRQAELVLRLLA